MKKYVKADLYYEDFELSTHIATCAFEWVNSLDVKNCKASGEKSGFPSGLYFFNSGGGGCDLPINDYCYTTGSSNNNLFNS